VDLLFVVSEYYRRQLGRETGKPLVLLPNGVEFDHFSILSMIASASTLFPVCGLM
jgi:hypothetical protein